MIPAPYDDTEAICERCIWTIDPEGLVRTGPCDPASWAGSIQQELLRHTTMPDIAARPGPHAAYKLCAALMMIKDEADIVFANLAWLYHIGVRRAVVLDNGSTDGTGNELRRFQAARPDAELVVVQDGIVAHFQAEKTTGIAQLAQQIWPDVEWLFPVDADEFCVARNGLHALAYVPERVRALTIPKTIHFLQAGHRSDAANPLARMPVRSGLFVVPPKVIIRARSGLGVNQGNHKAEAADGGAVVYAGGFQYGFFHREFQTRSFAQFCSKARNGGAAILAARAAGRQVGGDHWMVMHQVLSEQGEAGLRAKFDAECFRSPGGSYVLDPFFGAV